jgi:hypothetical protein
MPVCVCGHVHTDGCPCGCTIFQPDDGNEGGPTTARYMTYQGIYRGPYSLDQETA